MHIPKVLIVTDTDATWMAQIFPQKKTHYYVCECQYPWRICLQCAYCCKKQKQNEPKIKDWYFGAPKAHKKPDSRHFMKLCTIFERNVKWIVELLHCHWRRNRISITSHHIAYSLEIYSNPTNDNWLVKHASSHTIQMDTHDCFNILPISKFQSLAWTSAPFFEGEISSLLVSTE